MFADMRGLFRVSAEGGTPEALLTDLDASEQVLFPQLLPERRAILFTVIPTRTNSAGSPGRPRRAPGSRRWISRPESAGRSFAAAAEPSTCRPDT